MYRHVSYMSFREWGLTTGDNRLTLVIYIFYKNDITEDLRKSFLKISLLSLLFYKLLRFFTMYIWYHFIFHAFYVIIVSLCAMKAPLKICWLNPLQRDKTPSKNESPLYGTKLYLTVRLQFWSSQVFEVPFHCHYSHVHSDLEWLYFLESHLWIK